MAKDKHFTFYEMEEQSTDETLKNGLPDENNRHRNNEMQKIDIDIESIKSDINSSLMATQSQQYNCIINVRYHKISSTLT